MELISKKGIQYAVLKVTETGLNKSIMDATYPLRQYLKNKNYHDYNLQKKGEEYKITNQIFLLKSKEIITSKVSLYRPETKNGDPRIWVYGLKQHTNINYELMIIVKEDELYLINITQNNLNHLIQENNNNNLITEFVNSYNAISNVALELLEKIKSISQQGYLPAKKGDKEVGEVLERALNIKANSNKNPDYKGIELKSKFNLKTRANLFALVPEYKHQLSKIKKIYEIADMFGYPQNGQMVYRNTISALKANSQSLMFNVDFNNELLFETSVLEDKPKNFAVWPFEKLIERLEQKHQETFWVEASKKTLDGKTFFKYNKIVHTLNPNSHLLTQMINEGDITMDHLIVPVKNKIGQRKEKGPLFKIKVGSIPKLIPIMDSYELN